VIPHKGREVFHFLPTALALVLLTNLEARE